MCGKSLTLIFGENNFDLLCNFPKQKYLGCVIYLHLKTGYFVLYGLRMLCKFLAAGCNLYDASPQVNGPEWRMDMYRAGDQVLEMMFDLTSPVELPQFRGEFGLFHLFENAADTVLDQLQRQYFSADFVSPTYLLTRKFSFLV